MKTIQITPKETGLNIECGKIKFFLHHDQMDLAFDDAKKFCKERGGKLPSWKQLQVLSDFREDINKVLKELGKTLLAGWYWSKEECGLKDSNGRRPSALVVHIYGGYVYDYGKYDISYVRPVSAFQS